MELAHPYWNHYFDVLISYRRWILWRYEETPNAPPWAMVETTILFPNGKLYELPSHLPAPSPTLTPVEVGRVESWGWKFFKEDAPQASGNWRLANSKEACLEAAMQSFKYHGLIPDHFLILHTDKPMEKLPLDEKWTAFQKEAFNAVDQWQHNKGWPDGWKGKNNDAA